MKKNKQQIKQNQYQNSLKEARDKFRYFKIDLNKITKREFRILNRLFKDRQILDERKEKQKRKIKKNTWNPNYFQILKNIIPFSVRAFEHHIKSEEFKNQDIIDLINNVKVQKCNQNQNGKSSQKFELKELKLLIKNDEFVQEFLTFLSSDHYIEKCINQNKRISEEKKQSYKTASKMVINELQNPNSQKFQKFISKKNNFQENDQQEKSQNQNEVQMGTDHYINTGFYDLMFIESD